MAMSLTRGMNAQDIWDLLISLVDEPMSMGRMLRIMAGDYLHLYDHFEAITLADLLIPYSENVIGGGTSTLYLDDEPSAIVLETGAVLNDGIELTSDRTFSLAGVLGTMLVFEARLRINNEANLRWGAGIRNATTNIDMAVFHMDTGAGAPQPNGTIQSFVGGAAFYTDLGLAAAYDLTLYHIYRLEITPGVRIDAYVDDQLVGSEVTAVEVPDDQTFVAYFPVFTRANVNRELYIDWYRVWSE